MSVALAKTLDMFNKISRIDRPQVISGPMRGDQSNSGNVINYVPELTMAQHVSQELDGSKVINPGLTVDLGGISQGNMSPKGVGYFQLRFDNTGQPTRDFVIGTQNARDLALNADPIATSGSRPPAAINASFLSGPVLVNGVIYQTSATAGQLQQPATYHRGFDVNGKSRGSEPIPFAMAPRPTFQNALLLALQLPDPVRLGEFEFITLTVLADEIVDWTLIVAASSNR